MCMRHAQNILKDFYNKPKRLGLYSEFIYEFHHLHVLRAFQTISDQLKLRPEFLRFGRRHHNPYLHRRAKEHGRNSVIRLAANLV